MDSSTTALEHPVTLEEISKSVLDINYVPVSTPLKLQELLGKLSQIQPGEKWHRKTHMILHLGQLMKHMHLVDHEAIAMPATEHTQHLHGLDTSAIIMRLRRLSPGLLLLLENMYEIDCAASHFRDEIYRWEAFVSVRALSITSEERAEFEASVERTRAQLAGHPLSHPLKMKLVAMSGEGTE